MKDEEIILRAISEESFIFEEDKWILSAEVIGNIYEGLYSDEKLDILDEWKNNTEKQSQNPSKDTRSVGKQDEKSD